MPPAEFHDSRLTEHRNPRTTGIDVASPAEIVALLYAEDRAVPEAVFAEREAIARAIELVERAFRAGGRLIYVGAGTSGRLGVLDAAECPPTFGADPAMVQGVIAGGLDALTRSREGAEDDAAAGAAAVDDRDAGTRDVVFGIAASGTTPYVRGALERARAIGAGTVLLTCTDPPADLRRGCDLTIVVKVGPEALTGSTRLKAGTATKLVLNTVTTGAMVRLGKAWGNLMVDLRVISDKLRDRGERIVMEACGVDRDTARRAVRAASGEVKTAIVMLRRRVSADAARDAIRDAGGVIRNVIGDPPPVT